MRLYPFALQHFILPVIALFAAGSCAPPVPKSSGAGSGVDSDPASIPSVSENKETDVAIAGEVLLRVRDTYRNIVTYDGSIELESVTTWSDRRTFREFRQATVALPEPGVLHFVSRDSNGLPFTLDIRRNEVLVACMANYHSRSKEPVDVLIEFSGVSLNATRFLPGFLLEAQWPNDTFFLPSGDILSVFAVDAVLCKESEVRGHDCHCVRCDRPFGTWVLYVDKVSHLVRKVDYSASELQMAEQRRIGGGGRTGQIVRQQVSQLLIIERVTGVELGADRPRVAKGMKI